MIEILAKSEPPTTLKEHIDDGLAIWKHLKFAFPKAEDITNIAFWKLLRLAVVFHDLGKAHPEFQKVLKGKNNNWDKQRHEFFSLPFVQKLKLDLQEITLLERVILGHHKTYQKLKECYLDDFYESEEDFQEEFNLVDQKAIINLLNEYGSFNIGQVSPVYPKHIIRNYQKEIRDRPFKRWIPHLLLFGAFKQCDHLASAYVRQLNHLGVNSFEFLKRKRKEFQSKGLDFYEHQKLALTHTGNVILTAPTGSGKTETSLLWLKNQIKERGQGRVFYILPFTASINAMFLRLRNEKNGLGERNVGMLHGKLSAFLYEYFQDESSIHKKKDEINTLKSQFKTLESPLKVLTPFQLLKHLFGLKGFEKGVFEWTGGYFIFDEIHAYEPGVFAQIKVLLEFLTQNMSATIFIMTATLPVFIKRHLRESIGIFSEISASPKLYNEIKRHKLKLVPGRLFDNMSMITNDLEKNGKHRKVLIVCNTVEQAQEICKDLKDYSPLLIHGGFNAQDRNEKEKELEKIEPRILIGTQAIEVSLDIDYDIIYSEPAPLDALIQRFGRVNRKRKKGVCECVVFRARNEKDDYVYDENLIERTIWALEEIEKTNSGVIKEIELQNYIDRVYPDFDEKGKVEFELVYNSLSYTIKNNLTVFEHSKESEEQFYKQFDGIKVLPASLEKEYRNRLESYDFIGAELLKVSIRKGRFAGWLEDQTIEKVSLSLSIKKSTENPILVNYHVLKKKYQKDLGLLKDEDEERQVFDNML